MTETLSILLRIAGAGLLLLAFLHIPIARHLRWRDDCLRLSRANASVFRVHVLFICLVLVLMALPCLLDPGVFLERSRAGAWISWSFAVFWGIRLHCQWFVYPAELWRGKRMETGVHACFTIVWLALFSLFATCGLLQIGRLSF